MDAGPEGPRGGESEQALVIEKSGERRWRAAGDRADEEDAVELALDGDRAARLLEAAALERVGLLWIGAERARRAGRAVLWRFQVAQQIVVLELRRDEEQRVEHQRQRIEAPESAIRPAATRHISILRRTRAERYSGPPGSRVDGRPTTQPIAR